MSRLSLFLLARAARRWPAEVREESHQAWLADLHALTTDPHTGRFARSWQALRFSASLAVRRPEPSTAPVMTTVRPGPHLFGAAMAVAVAGTLAAMLLVNIPAAVADRFPGADPDDALHRFPLLALVPALVAVGVLAGRLMARRDAPRGVTRTVIVIVVGWWCARLLPIFGDVVTALPGLALWALCLWAAAQVAVRLARRPRGPLPWIALGAGVLLMADLAVTAAVWLGLGADAAPRAHALSWFPGALLDDAVPIAMGTDAAGDPVNTAILDLVELLPHGLIVVSAFTLAYLYTAARPAPAPA